MNKNIGCVIVTYFPDKEFKQRLELIIMQVDFIVIVDNSSTENGLKIEGSPNLKIIKNNENLGISKALNIGCDFLLNKNYRYALLLDQDSEIGNNMVAFLFDSIKNNNNWALVGPQILPKNITSKEISKKLKYMTYINSLILKKSSVLDEPLKVAFNITSGSLINLKIWNEIGNFWETLFIEGVDTEYGLRANSLGFDVFIDNNAKLYQEYGNQKEIRILGKSFFPTFHSPLRYYYLARNKIYIWNRHYRKHPYFIIWDALSFFKSILEVLLFENNKFKKFQYIIKGFYDVLIKKKKGRIE